jgi:hypothetical protein
MERTRQANPRHAANIAQLDLTPRLMKARHAAQYLGMSESTLRGLPIPRRQVGALRLYDRADLDAWADAQPYELDHGDREEANPCDAIFGMIG